MAVLTINRGLVTSPNELSKPDGAAEVLDNCVIDFDNVVEPRRGFGEFGNKTPDDSVIKQVMTYKGRILRHYANKISFDSTGNGTFVDFSGTYSELVERLRIKYFELNSNLYFTTSEGIKKISAKSADDFTNASNYITNAGIVKAIGFESSLVPSASGFLPAQSKVAYSILWAKKDANGNITRGVPSSRLVVTNTSKDVNTGESFTVSIADEGAGIHKSFDATSSISDGVQTIFLAAAVNIVDNTIALTSGATDHNYQTNDLVKVRQNGSDALPTGLAAGNYYIIRVDTNKVKLKTTTTGTEVDITAAGVSGIIESTNVGKTITIPSHGYTDGTKVRLFGVIANELDDTQTYYIRNKTTDTFQLSATDVGPIITLTKKVGTSQIYSGLSNNDFFLFDSPTNKFAVWFNVSGDDPSPTSSLLLGRQLIQVPIYNITIKNKINYASKIAESLFSVSDIQVEVGAEVITITNRDGGDVLDANQGTIDITYATVSKVVDGQTSTGTPANVSLSFIVPTEIIQTNDTLYFYEVYRTGIITVQAPLTLSDIDPGEEFQKVFEGPVLESGTVIPSTIVYDDYVPESFRQGGLFLYTNPVSGEGIIQSNEAPPIARDVAVFKGSAFYANTKEKHRVQFNILGVDQYLGILKFNFDPADVVSDFIEITSHGFENGNKIRFYGDTPSASIIDGETYYVVNSEPNKFQVSLTLGGPALVLTAGTSSCWVYNVSKVSKFYIGNSTTLRTYSFIGVNQVLSFTAKKKSETTGGSYFDIYSAQDRIKYRVWFDQGGSTPPTQDGALLLRVPLDAYDDDTADAAALAFQEAFFDIPDFSVTVLADKVTITYKDNGAVSPVVESATPTGWNTPVVEQVGIGENPAELEVLLSGLTSQALSIEDTARSLEKVINKDVNSPVNAFYISGSDNLPGNILLEAKSLTDDPFYLGFSHATSTAVFEPALPVANHVSNIQSSGLLNLQNIHGYTTGQQVYCFVKTSSDIILSGNKIVSSTPSTTSITLQGFGPTTALSSFEENIIFSSDVVSDNSVNPNRVYFSKIQQPEAVPLVNYLDIGPKDKAIQRIMALRDSLVVLKEDGVYIISGSSAPNFSVRLSDSSALTFAPDTATNLNNLIYVLTSQGVATVSETGVGIISRNIEDRIQQVANAKFNYKLMSWGVSSESDRCYILWLPEKTTDMYATQAFRYNTFTRTWTRWTKPANCGVVNPSDDKIYLGDSSGRPYVLKERKNFERQDYADREIELNIGANAINGLTYTLSSVAELSAGDVLVQSQYLDINKFNRLLKRLDRDGFSSNPTKYITLKAIAGDSLGSKLQQLESKLLSDSVPVTPTSGSENFQDLRDDFNNLIDEINDSASGTNFKDYKKVEDLLIYETLITSVNLRVNSVSVKFTNKFVQGPVSVFKGIRSIVQYAPQHFGKPEATKQVPDGTFIFDQNNFWGGSVAYSSDRSYDFTAIEFTSKGPGYWDGYSWANTTFGGEGNEVPVRTLIPIQKARCRYLHVQFTHINAREGWKLIGVSLEPREVSTRGYR